MGEILRAPDTQNVPPYLIRQAIQILEGPADGPAKASLLFLQIQYFLRKRAEFLQFQVYPSPMSSRKNKTIENKALKQI